MYVITRNIGEVWELNVAWQAPWDTFTEGTGLLKSL